MTELEEVQPEFNYEVNICGKITEITAPDVIEAATRAIEHYRKIQENFDIGTIIQVTEVNTKTSRHIVSEVALANAGLYLEARQLQEYAAKKKKK